RGERQVCDSGRLCCKPSLPSAHGDVQVGCRNDQCTCLNGGLTCNYRCCEPGESCVNGTCTGGGNLSPFNFALTCCSGDTRTCTEVTQYGQDEAQAEMIVQNNYANCDVELNGSCPS